MAEARTCEVEAKLAQLNLQYWNCGW